MKKLTIVNADYWQALYVDGKCVDQHHEIDLIHWLKRLNIIDIEEVEAYNHPELEDIGAFPDDLKDVVKD